MKIKWTEYVRLQCTRPDCGQRRVQRGGCKARRPGSLGATRGRATSFASVILTQAHTALGHGSRDHLCWTDEDAEVGSCPAARPGPRRARLGTVLLSPEAALLRDAGWHSEAWLSGEVL